MVTMPSDLPRPPSYQTGLGCQEAEKHKRKVGDEAEETIGIEEGRGENHTCWSDSVNELVKEFPMYYSSWPDIEKSKKAHIKRRLMRDYWNVKPSKIRDVEAVRSRPPLNMEQSNWDKNIEF
nr:hypothetical protein [Tanacetum cinerariifolium]